MKTVKRKDVEKILIAENSEYAEICNILEKYLKYRALYHQYFCDKNTIESMTNVREIYKFNKQYAEKNANFISQWEERKKKIKARMKKNKYFSHGGRIGDEKELRKGEQKFKDLTLFFELKEQFSQLEEFLQNQEGGKSEALVQHMRSLKKKKQEIESDMMHSLNLDVEVKKASDSKKPEKEKS